MRLAPGGVEGCRPGTNRCLGRGDSAIAPGVGPTRAVRLLWVSHVKLLVGTSCGASVVWVAGDLDGVGTGEAVQYAFPDLLTSARRGEGTPP